MKINYNVAAYTANARLLQNESQLTTSLERLSSGFRINRASDDPAGTAMGAKLRTQIKGLEQAERNASDGESVLQTAEGALQEVTTIVQRMRSLAVQAGNDTYAIEDKQAMQDEIEKLKEEINRVSTDTEFNKLTLLDGSMCSRIYADTRTVSLAEVSSTVKVGIYKVNLIGDAKRAVVKGNAVPSAVLDTYKDADGIVRVPKGAIDINGSVVKFDGTESEAEAYTKLRDAAEIGEASLFAYTTDPTAADFLDSPETEGYKGELYSFGKALAFVARDTGSADKVEIKCSDDNIAKFFGLGVSDPAVYGKDVEISLSYTSGGSTVSDFSGQASIDAEGNRVKITDMRGFEMSFDIDTATLKNEGVTEKEININVTDVGKMMFQIGANENQIVNIDIPEVSTRTLRLDKIDVTTQFGTDKSLKALDRALEKVNSIRSEIGATQNRLSFIQDDIGEVNEDMTAALSRIEDIDMATEMSTYTQYNVLVQAATSVLAQANDIPEQTLQLLQ